jgi:phospholipid/cholesterol/gamma-HCH transport system substrate-binding protein
MNQDRPDPDRRDDDLPLPVRNLELKAALLLAGVLLLIAASVLYVLHARGVFEDTQRLVLVADDSEGVIVGMDLSFSGFPIGRVRSVELGADGNARILIDVPRKDARWLRESSVFTLVRGLVGNTSLRAYTGIPTDPPPADGAERRVLMGDATAEIPRLVSDARGLVANLTALTAADGALARSAANLEAATAKLAGDGGALGLAMGNDADRRKVIAALDRSNALLARVDAAVAKADRQLLGDDGVVAAARASLRELEGVLTEARGTLKQVDALLAQAEGIAGDVRGATTDLGQLRAEVDASLRKVERLIDDLSRKWPFAPKPADAELRLP